MARKVNEDVEVLQGNEGEEMVTIKLPRTKDEDAHFVSVNERTWLIKRGVKVSVPVCCARAIELSEEMMEESDNYSDANSK